MSDRLLAVNHTKKIYCTVAKTLDGVGWGFGNADIFSKFLAESWSGDELVFVEETEFDDEGYENINKENKWEYVD